MTPLLDAALDRLRGHRATRNIPESLNQPDYDRAFGEKICLLVRQTCEQSGSTFERALDDFITASAEFLKLQRQLERTGAYPCPSFEQARRAIYDNAELMSTTYSNGLLLSQALWINHFRIFDFFRRRFCPAPPGGRVLEVPLGTGLFLSEFLDANPAWQAEGVDLSPAVIEFARRLMRLCGSSGATLRARDVFDIDAAAFDRIICGELLEHLDQPRELLAKLDTLLAEGGRLFLTTAIWAASADHVYLFESAAEVRTMLAARFQVLEERVLPLEPDMSPEASRVPINYACILGRAVIHR